MVGLIGGGSLASKSGSIGGGGGEKRLRKQPCSGYCGGDGARAEPGSIAGHEVVTMVPIWWLEADCRFTGDSTRSGKTPKMREKSPKNNCES